MSILWFSFYIDPEFAGVHSKCFSCRLCPRCLHTEISTFFLSLSHVAHSSPKSWNERILCVDSRPFSLSGVLCTVNASVASCTRAVCTPKSALFIISLSCQSCSGSKSRNECNEKACAPLFMRPWTLRLEVGTSHQEHKVVVALPGLMRGLRVMSSRHEPTSWLSFRGSRT